MTEKRPFHILYALRYLRYGLLLCLVPMARALLAFDLQSFYTALRQDAAILAVFAVVALVLRRATAFWMDGQALHCEKGVLARSHYTYARAGVAALEVARPLYCRLMGASKVTLYFKSHLQPRTFDLYLKKQDAAALADALLPARTDVNIFAPTGFERLSLVMLSANILTSCAFAWMTLDRLDPLVGLDLQQLAEQNIGRLAGLAARLMPAGLAAAATLVFLGGAVTFLYSFLHTFGFSVCRNGGVLISRGGLVTKLERRILGSAVSACEVRVTPAARLLRRYPVYVSAGSFRGGDIPLMVFKKNSPHSPEALLPGYAPAPPVLCDPARKSYMQYLWQPGALLALALAVTGVALARMPALVPVLLVPDALLLAALAVAAEGYFREGICRNENRSIGRRFTRRLTRCEVCVLTPDLAYTLFETPFATSGGRCDVTVHLPCGLRYKVRGVLKYAVQELPFTL